MSEAIPGIGALGIAVLNPGYVLGGVWALECVAELLAKPYAD